MVLLKRKLYFFQGSRGDPTFSGGGGVQLFPGCDFRRGVPKPLIPPSGSAHGTGTCTSQESGTVYPGNEPM